MKAHDDQDLTTKAPAAIAAAEAHAASAADYLRAVLARFGACSPTFEQIATDTAANLAAVDRWLNNKTNH